MCPLGEERLHFRGLHGQIYKWLLNKRQVSKNCLIYLSLISISTPVPQCCSIHVLQSEFEFLAPKRQTEIPPKKYGATNKNIRVLLFPPLPYQNFANQGRRQLCYKYLWLSFFFLFSCITGTWIGSSKQCIGFKLSDSHASLWEAHSENPVISQRIYSFLSSFIRSLC